jgi:hypothetical protein
MRTSELVEKIQDSVVVVLDPERLPGLLEVAETLRVEDTRLSGWIRILRIDGQIAVQEQTPEGEILLRGLASLDAAHQHVDQRLLDYERMWDGCGCRIDYHG